MQILFNVAFLSSIFSLIGNFSWKQNWFKKITSVRCHRTSSRYETRRWSNAKLFHANGEVPQSQQGHALVEGVLMFPTSRTNNHMSLTCSSGCFFVDEYTVTHPVAMFLMFQWVRLAWVLFHMILAMACSCLILQSFSQFLFVFSFYTCKCFSNRAFCQFLSYKYAMW